MRSRLQLFVRVRPLSLKLAIESFLAFREALFLISPFPWFFHSSFKQCFCSCRTSAGKDYSCTQSSHSLVTFSGFSFQAYLKWLYALSSLDAVFPYHQSSFWYSCLLQTIYSSLILLKVWISGPFHVSFKCHLRAAFVLFSFTYVISSTPSFDFPSIFTYDPFLTVL